MNRAPHCLAFVLALGWSLVASPTGANPPDETPSAKLPAEAAEQAKEFEKSVLDFLFKKSTPLTKPNVEAAPPTEPPLWDEVRDDFEGQALRYAVYSNVERKEGKLRFAKDGVIARKYGEIWRAELSIVPLWDEGAEGPVMLKIQRTDLSTGGAIIEPTEEGKTKVTLFAVSPDQTLAFKRSVVTEPASTWSLLDRSGLLSVCGDDIERIVKFVSPTQPIHFISVSAPAGGIALEHLTLRTEHRLILTAAQRTRLDEARSHRGMAFAAESEGAFWISRRRREIELAIKREILGPKHYATLLARHELAGTLEAQGDYAGARREFEAVLAIERETLGDRHPNVLASRSRASRKKIYGGETQVGLEELRGVYKEYCEEFGENSRDAMVERLSLIHAVAAFEDEEQALAEYLDLRENAERELGAEDELALVVRASIADLQLKRGDAQSAAHELAELLRIEEASLLEDFRDEVLSLRQSYAQALHRLGDHDGAYAQLKLALEAQLWLMEQSASGQSERQQLAMLQSSRSTLDSLLSLPLSTSERDAEIFGFLLRIKGLVGRRQMQLRALAGNPDHERAFVRLSAVAEELDRRCHLVPRNPGEAEEARRSIDDLSREKESIEAELAGRSPAFQNAMKVVRLEDLASALPPGHLLVEAFVYTRSGPSDSAPNLWSSEPNLTAFAFDRGGKLTRVELGPIAPIEAAVEAWRLGRMSSADAERAGTRLRRLLIEPLADSMRNAETLLIGLDGPLLSLPFAALPGKLAGSYLGDEIEVVQLSNAAELPQLMGPRSPLESTGLLAFGSIAYGPATDTPSDAKNPEQEVPSDGLEFRSLTHTGPEIVAIESLYRVTHDDDRVESLMAEDASEIAFRAKAKGFRYLHVATHGYYTRALLAAGNESVNASSLPGRVASTDATASIAAFHPGLIAGLAFAGANHSSIDGSGLLTAEEVSTLDLSTADLVVLSACQTGLGDRRAGEGPLSLQRSFRLAGARTVVASLWPVDDRATKALMTEFYRNLWERKTTKLEALRMAQRTLREDYVVEEDGLRRLDRAIEIVEGPSLPRRSMPTPATPDSPTPLPPHYWAGWTLVGDWR